MKIMHLIRGGDSGGAKTHLFTLLDELQKYVECEVVCLIPGVFYREILDKDIKTTLFPQKNRFDLSVVKKIKNLIEEDGVDILHVHGAMANFIAQFLKKKIDIKKKFIIIHLSLQTNHLILKKYIKNTRKVKKMMAKVQ